MDPTEDPVTTENPSAAGDDPRGAWVAERLVLGAAHGPCACGFAIRVKDGAKAEKLAKENGAKFFANKPETLALSTTTLEGIGGAALYLVDKGEAYEDEFEYITAARLPTMAASMTFCASSWVMVCGWVPRLASALASVECTSSGLT